MTCAVVVDSNGAVCGKCTLVCPVDKSSIEGIKPFHLASNTDTRGEDAEDSLSAPKVGDFDGSSTLMECGPTLTLRSDVFIGPPLSRTPYFDGCFHDGDLC